MHATMGQKTQWQHLDDGLLVAATKVGRTEAFDELARRYMGVIRGVAYSIVGHKEAAEDVMQDALLIAYRSVGQLKQPERFANWLYSIARHRAIRLSQTGKKATLEPLMAHEPDLMALSQSIEDPAEVFDRQETVSGLHRAMLSLPPEYRVVLELRYWRQLKIRVIGETLGIPETSVKWRLHKAKKLLALKCRKENIR